MSKEKPTTVPFTAMVITYNEDERLRECLNSVSFCDQLVVVDLGSDDQSVEIARDCGAEVFHHERLPTPAQVRTKIMHHAKHDWIVLIDPDEIFDSRLVKKVRSIVEEKNNVASIRLPWKFYYNSKPLKGTKWGGKQHKAFVVNKNRVDFIDKVHRGMDVHAGFDVVTIPWEDPDVHIKHYWIDSYWEFLEKHWRYIKREGEARYQDGERFSWKTWIYRSIGSFKRSLIDQEGWRDGVTGFILSTLWAWYKSASLLSLYFYQRRVSE